jgi:hypothetical protein
MTKVQQQLQEDKNRRQQQPEAEDSDGSQETVDCIDDKKNKRSRNEICTPDTDSLCGRTSLDGLTAEERLVLTRERNRDHSRKSRIRKKAFIEGMKKQVDDLKIFQMLAEDAGDLISILFGNEQATVKFAGSAFQRELGHDPASLQGMSFFKIIHDDDAKAVRAAVQKARICSDASKCSFQIQHASGHYLRAEASLRLLPSLHIAIITRLAD